MEFITSPFAGYNALMQALEMDEPDLERPSTYVPHWLRMSTPKRSFYLALNHVISPSPTMRHYVYRSIESSCIMEVAREGRVTLVAILHGT